MLGDDALLNNTGTDNTAIGFNTLLNNTIGHANTAIGFSALFSNTIGNLNTAHRLECALFQHKRLQ